MILAIFGATGRTGLPLVQQALEAGHEVVALVRTPAKMTITHDNLTVIQGDAMDVAAVERVIEGADVVLSALGHTKNTPADMQTVATRHMINAMKKHHVRRIVSLTGGGVSAPQDEPKVFDHIIKFALKMVSGKVLKDAEEHAKVLRESDRDWILVRGPMLTEGPHTGDYRVGWVGVNVGPRIPRADVADFMLKQVTDDAYVHKAPMISS